MPLLIKNLFTGRYGKIVRYLISGGTAAAVDLAFLYFFVSWLGMWYVLAATLAFILAFGVSFTLQKFWTFADRSTDQLHSQLAIYFTVALVNLGLNAILMYVLVDFVYVPYMIAQIIAAGLIACESFFVYQKFVFLT